MRAGFRGLLIHSIYFTIDVVLIVLSIYGAAYLRSSTLPFDVTFHNLFLNPDNAFRFVFALWVVTVMFMLERKALYQTRREILEGYEIGHLLNAVLTSTFIVIVAIYVLKIEGFPRTIIGLGTLFICVVLSIWRIIKRLFVNYIVARGYNNMNVLIVGKGKVGATLLNEIRKRPDMGLNVVGFLDDFKGMESDVKKDEKILGKIADFKKICRKEFVHKVFITVHHNSEMFLQILEDAKKLGVAVRVVPQGFQLMSSDYMKYNIGIIPVLEYCHAAPLVRQVGKRMFDLFLVAPAIIVLLPFYFLVSLVIMIDSPGLPIYISYRFGRRGVRFGMFKFRSMYVDADKEMQKLVDANEVDGPIFKMKNDPRVTRVGRWLRRYSVDEFPQLFNVLLGHMSLVGPRPLPTEQIRKEDFRQLRRLDVRPGITGLWQIRGRSDISFVRLVKWDMWYINNWSLWLDLNILFQTVPVVIKGRGAY